MNKKNNNTADFDLYQQYIAKSRYARFLPEKNRRENWEETVARYFDFMEEHIRTNYNYDLKEIRPELEQAVLDLKVMPSMRAMMTAGPALARDSTAGFNCSFIAIDDPKAFDEAMHILLCGTGVGFSVERQYVNQLPEIPEKLFDSDTTIIVKDSKEGWAKAFRQLIALLYTGEIPKQDLSKIRPAGARLKVFGGRASGPGPLDELFKFTINIFKNAVGRKLTSIEAHDIMCRIGETVVSGGVRRSALISLSNLSDDRMRHAKSGAWWEYNVQRALANNSAVYTEKPDVGMFMQEWLALYESKSGERGIFNREAAINQVKKIGRRKSDFAFGVNPCLHPDSMVETINGPVRIADMTEPCFVYTMNLENKIVLRKASSSWISKKNVETIILKTNSGNELICTPDHKIYTENRGWIEAKAILSEDRIAQVCQSLDGQKLSFFNIKSIEHGPVTDVYDLSVEDTHNFIANSIIVHNCGEILLRPNSFCNLSEVVVRPDDTIDTLKKKIEIATILGTIQSTLTYFPYLRKIWTKNTEEERLLGVSLTGIHDNPMLNKYDDPDLPTRLEDLKNTAIETNKVWAEKIGISVSAAITTIKPSGTIGELVNSASGIHPRHAAFYYRRVRASITDPLTKFMIDAGIPAEPDVTKPNSTMVFTFPKKSPKESLLREQLSSLDHLRLWLVYRQNWTEHNPSVTISVKESEWPSVGAWVWENFDNLTGVSFLPYDGGSYRQPPYEEVTEEQYNELLAKMPKELDWDSLIEEDDNVEGTQMLACVSGGCVI